ncbi:amidohydrolase family protein [Pararhodobacter zhoushanensis]|uniref:amidohydrolase family protein n=1 Tax=Pararhodobacter zhoushanensis TaxID=2479545 RepID=UPI000F8E5164|nr:amidohydrolase family protein [Pararhodobacter zhoushanensis]
MSDTLTKPRAITTAGAIDTDVHPPLPRQADLLPYVDDYWKETFQSRDIDVLELMSAPERTKPYRRPDWVGEGDALVAMQKNLLDPLELGHAILNVVSGAHALFDPYLAQAVCRATNDWLADTWLDRDSRLRGSMLVPFQNVPAAVAEIERLASDKRFVQILTLAAGELPLGRQTYWPIFEAAEKHGLPIGIHAGSMLRHAPSHSGYHSFLIEDHIAMTQGFATQIASMIAEGVFAKYPDLKVVAIESGVSWIPPLMWRMSKDWRGTRIEVPWVKDSPAALIRRHVRVTSQPFDGPEDPAEVEKMLSHLLSDDMLLFSSDYPHWHYEGLDVLPHGVPDALLQKAMRSNALATYPRLGG